MQRRAELARALINDPAVLILDEPFRGLDAMTRELMQEYIAELLAERRRTTLFITTDIDEALLLADRAAGDDQPADPRPEASRSTSRDPPESDLLADEQSQQAKGKRSRLTGPRGGARAPFDHPRNPEHSDNLKRNDNYDDVMSAVATAALAVSTAGCGAPARPPGTASASEGEASARSPSATSRTTPRPGPGW